MIAPRVLLVEDDATIREMTWLSLERDGFTVEVAADGPAGLAAFPADVFDAVLLDVMMPGMDGLTVCRRIRETSRAPIIMLTARGDEADRVVGLEFGADDYVPKPFSPRELLARLRAVLRRAERRDSSSALNLGRIEVDTAGMVVRVDGDVVTLTPTEYRLLVELAQNAGIVRSREQLLEDVWGYVWAGDTRLVDMHVRRLRAKIGPEAIETVRGAGYKLVRP